jgi:hypothetical protein
MSSFKQRIVARVRALLPSDWLGAAGDRFRAFTKSLSRVAEEKDLKPERLLGEGIELGRRKLTGLANHEFSGALKNFAEVEDLKIETELKKRSLESKVRQDEADARLKELKVVEAELGLIRLLKAEGLVLHRDGRGNLTILPDQRRISSTAPEPHDVVIWSDPSDEDR